MNALPLSDSYFSCQLLGMDEFIANVFTDVQMTEGTLSLDNVLNHHYQSNDETSLRTIYTIITNITSMCYNIQV